MLPDKPSELIRIAIEDLREVEYDPRYKIDMGTWHDPNPNSLPNGPGICYVCFAGAVMAGHLDIPPDKLITPDKFDKDTSRKLEALNSFRMGFIWSALWEMRLNKPDGLPEYFDVEDEYFDDDDGSFYRDMEALADLLQKYGL